MALPPLPQIIEQVEDYAILTLDNEGSILTWNKGAERVLGYCEEEVLGRAFDLIFTPEDRDEDIPKRELETARREGRTVDNRWHLRKDGSRFWANGVLSALFDKAGYPDGFVKIARDLTREHEAEKRLQASNEALRQSEARFSQAFYVSPIPGCLTTLGEETFLQVNTAFTQLTGYTSEEVIEQSSVDLGMWSSPEDRAKLEATTREDADEGYRDLELHLQTKAGETRTILGSGVHMEVDGAEIWLKSFYDVTEQKRSEEQLYRALQEVMSDTAWFSQQVMERLAQIRAGNPDAAPSVELTPRERQVLMHIAQGKGNEVIATELDLATQTVRNYISNLYDKLGVHSRAEAVVWARERGIV